MKFDRVVVVSLERRRDRLDAFMSRVPSDWGYGEIEVFRAVDGRMCKHPDWWRQGGGAWGCYRSHVRILEDALNFGHERVLIFEDDATFCADFMKHSLRYFEALPDNWVQAYLGGQHLRKAVAVPGNPLVVRAQNINRTHAFAVNGRQGIIGLYKWLCATDKWVNRNHIDHHFGRLHFSAAAGYYAPAQWLCGQASGHSDISWKQTEERWWYRKNAELLPPNEEGDTTDERANEDESVKITPGEALADVPFVAVMGLHRSGSSCVAMMLHKLGVNMGDNLVGYESKNGGGGEAAGLARICERAARFPSVGFSRPVDQVRRNLRSWVMARVAKARKHGQLPGGKYPHLCAMGTMLWKMCGTGLRVIHCDRPLDESIDSLKRRSAKSTGWLSASDDQCEKVQRWLWNKKSAFLAAIPEEQVLHVQHARCLQEPHSVVREMVDFLKIAPSEEQIAAAVAHVKQGEKT